MIKDLHTDGRGLVQASIRGLMSVADQRALEDVARRIVDEGQAARLIVTLDDFHGWQKDPEWGEDLEFQFHYGTSITRMAIVGDASWKEQALLYVGKGFRDTRIEFFPHGEREDAMRWIEQA